MSIVSKLNKEKEWLTEDVKKQKREIKSIEKKEKELELKFKKLERFAWLSHESATIPSELFQKYLNLMQSIKNKNKNYAEGVLIKFGKQFKTMCLLCDKWDDIIGLFDCNLNCLETLIKNLWENNYFNKYASDPLLLNSKYLFITEVQSDNNNNNNNAKKKTKCISKQDFIKIFAETYKTSQHEIIQCSITDSGLFYDLKFNVIYCIVFNVGVIDSVKWLISEKFPFLPKKQIFAVMADNCILSIEEEEEPTKENEINYNENPYLDNDYYHNYNNKHRSHRVENKKHQLVYLTKHKSKKKTLIIVADPIKAIHVSRYFQSYADDVAIISILFHSAQQFQSQIRPMYERHKNENNNVNVDNTEKENNDDIDIDLDIDP